MEEHDIDSYISEMETVVKKKMELYQNLYGRIQRFKSFLKEEEEVATQVVSSPKIYC